MRLGILIGIAILLGAAAVLVWRQGDDAPRPTLSAAEIANLPEAELMRRLRLDLLARSIAAGRQAVSVPTTPVQRTLAFEESRIALGTTAAVDGSGGATALAEAYAALGAHEVAACLRRLGTAPDAEHALVQALARAGLEHLRATWVRSHPEKFQVAGR